MVVNDFHFARSVRPPQAGRAMEGQQLPARDAFDVSELGLRSSKHDRPGSRRRKERITTSAYYRLGITTSGIAARVISHPAQPNAPPGPRPGITECDAFSGQAASRLPDRISCQVMDMDERLIHEIVRRVLTVSKPDRIILFGSAAREQMTSDSDIDLLVVEPSPSDALRESVVIGDALRGLGFPFDVIVIGAERFEETKEIFGGIAYPAHKDGKVLYEAG